MVGSRELTVTVNWSTVFGPKGVKGIHDWLSDCDSVTAVKAMAMAAMGATQHKPALKKPRNTLEMVPTTVTPATPRGAFSVSFSNVVTTFTIEESNEYFQNLKWDGASAEVQSIFSMSVSRKHDSDYIRSCTLRWLKKHGHTPPVIDGLLNYLQECKRKLSLHVETRPKAYHMEAGDRFNINYRYECTPFNQHLSVLVETYHWDALRRGSVYRAYRHLIDNEDELNGVDSMEVDSMDLVDWI